MANIKKEYQKTVVGFNNSATPLGERNDLDLLLEIAIKSGDESLKQLFEEIPTEEEFNKQKEVNFIEVNSENVTEAKKK